MDDERLLADVRDAIRDLDPVPPEVTLAARSALAWRRLDAQLADLLHDSAVEGSAPAGTRSTAGLRALTYESPVGAALELEIADEAGLRRLMGQVVPPAVARVEVRHAGGTLTVTSNRLGQFRVEAVPPGPMSIRWQSPDGDAVETGWVVI